MKNRMLELFGRPTQSAVAVPWRDVVASQHCPYLGRTCLKVRKSQPDIAIGSCAVANGKDWSPVAICPHRLRERGQVFTDCLHLLSLHQPGNELFVVPEVSLPGGSVDYFLVSARDGHVKDFIGIEFQTLDTTGTVWPERQRFLASMGIDVSKEDVDSEKGFGMNWKMTAKTILVQLHHKVETFEKLNKHFVLVLQDCLLAYMKEEFSFGHMVNPAVPGDFMQIHAYAMKSDPKGHRLALASRLSTDAAGIAKALGLQTSPNVAMEVIVKTLEARLTEDTRFNIGDSRSGATPSAPILAREGSPRVYGFNGSS